MLQRRIFLAATVLAFAAMPAAAQMPAEINFGILSTESQMNLKPRYVAFIADMEKQTGLKINAFYAPDYAGIIEAMRFGKVQAAWLGNASAILAADRANAEVFAQNVAPDGTHGYHTFVIVHKESPIKDFDDLLKSAGKYSFSNGDPNSTSGFLVPSYYAWALNNIDIRKHFTRVVSGNHEVNALAVANRQVDVSTVSSEAVERLAQTSPDKEKLLRVIWKSPLIPLDPIVWRTDLPAPIKDRMREFFVTYGQEKPGKPADQLAQEKAVLANVQTGYFRPSSNKQLIPLRQIGLFRDKIKIEADDKMSADEKAAKIREIDAKLAQLQREIAS
jgi:phosphonate transport system substrate-binding protein